MIIAGAVVFMVKAKNRSPAQLPSAQNQPAALPPAPEPPFADEPAPLPLPPAPQDPPDYAEPNVVREKVIERQVVVTRCQFCGELTPMDLSACKSCGGKVR